MTSHSDFDEGAARDTARTYAEKAFALLAHAINACDNPGIAYKFSSSDRSKILLALRSVQDVIENGHIQMSRAEGAKRDIKYQEFRTRLLSFEVKD